MVSKQPGRTGEAGGHRSFVDGYTPLIEMWQGSTPIRRWLVLSVLVVLYVFSAAVVVQAWRLQRALDADGVTVPGWVLQRTYLSRPSRHLLRVHFEAEGRSRVEEVDVPGLSDFDVKGCLGEEGRHYPLPEVSSEDRVLAARGVCRSDSEHYLPYPLTLRYLPTDPTTLRIEGNVLGVGWVFHFILALPLLLLILVPPIHRWNEARDTDHEDDNAPHA